MTTPSLIIFSANKNSLTSDWVRLHSVSQSQSTRLKTPTWWPELKKAAGRKRQSRDWPLLTSNSPILKHSQPLTTKEKTLRNQNTRTNSNSGALNLSHRPENRSTEQSRMLLMASYCFNSENTRWFSSLSLCCSSQQSR